MATFFYRQKHSRRRLAALNFLSNISLDGSLHDNNSKCESSCKGNLLNESFAKDSKDKVSVKSQKQSVCDVNEILGLKEESGDEDNNQSLGTNYIQTATSKDEGKNKTEQEVFKKVTSTATVRERFVFEMQELGSIINCNLIL